MPLDSVCEPVAAFAKELTGDLTVGWPGVIRMPRVRTSNDFHILSKSLGNKGARRKTPSALSFWQPLKTAFGLKSEICDRRS